MVPLMKMPQGNTVRGHAFGNKPEALDHIPRLPIGYRVKVTFAGPSQTLNQSSAVPKP